MKANDFLKLVAGNVGIAIPDEVLAKLGEELPETFDTKFTEVYLTRERAKSDDEIITEITKKSNKTVLTAADEQIKELLNFVSDEAKQKINSVFSTPEKLKLLKPALDEALTKAKGKLTPDDIRKVEDEWSAKNKAIIEEGKQKEATLIKQMEERNFDFITTSKLAAYNVADPFKNTREQINAMAILALKQKGYKYELENGAIVVRQEKDGITRDVFENDKKVTFESLIDGFMQPFIAKSNANDDSKRDEDPKKLLPIDGKEDLRTMMFKQANNDRFVQV